MTRAKSLPAELCRYTPRERSVPPTALRARYEGSEFALASGDPMRRELLARLRAGEVIELEIAFRAFQQLDGVANKNFVRFKKGILRKLAKSFEGTPFLRDHDTRSLSAKAGSVLESKPVAVEGGTAFDMVASVTAGWAVTALLELTIDRFSIGWDYPELESIHCSACKAPIFTKCDHFPGEKVGAKVVEFIFTEAVGEEVSAVLFPAVEGTGITDIRAALNHAARAVKRETREVPMLKEIARSLGLAEDADESTILAAIEARNAAATAAQQEAARAQQASKQLEAQVSDLSSKLEESSQRERVASIDKLFTEFADRLPIARDAEGNVVESALETKLRKLAEDSVDAARDILSSLPSASPAGAALQARPTEVAQPSQPSALGNSNAVAKACNQLGLSDDDFAKFNPVNGTHTTGRWGQ